MMRSMVMSILVLSILTGCVRAQDESDIPEEAPIPVKRPLASVTLPWVSTAPLDRTRPGKGDGSYRLIFDIPAIPVEKGKPFIIDGVPVESRRLGRRLREFGKRAEEFRDPEAQRFSITSVLLRCDQSQPVSTVLEVKQACEKPNVGIRRIDLATSLTAHSLPCKENLERAIPFNIAVDDPEAEERPDAGLTFGIEWRDERAVVTILARRLSGKEVAERLPGVIATIRESGRDLSRVRIRVTPELPLRHLLTAVSCLGVSTRFERPPVIQLAVGPENWKPLLPPPYGRRDSPAARRGRGRAGRQAIDRGLEWLARHQSRDGRWDADGFMNNGEATRGPLCDGSGGAAYDVGVTGLALLAFFGAGQGFHGDYSKTIVRAISWLSKQQDKGGFFASSGADRPLWPHVVATHAMVEAYAMGERDPAYEPMARRAVEALLRAQSPYKGWKYGIPNDNRDDISITAWAMYALDTARRAGIEVNKRSLEWGHSLIDAMTDEETGRTGYELRGEPPARYSPYAEVFPSFESEGPTAAAIHARVLCGENPAESAMIKLGIQNCVRRKMPNWDTARGSIDFYYWFFGTLALHQVGGKAWSQWWRATESALVQTPRTDGNFNGSWDPVGVWGSVGGRVYASAINVLTLSTPFRCMRRF